MKIKFIGACGEVTGSMHLVEVEGMKILLDCGMRQGHDTLPQRDFPFDPTEIDYLILSHAHVDHSGLIPYLFLKGFKGRVITTPATKAVAELLLLDCAKIMEEDPRKPTLYSDRDVIECLNYFDTYEWGNIINLDGKVKVKFLDAGHILGASITLLKGEGITLCYTGDIGPGNTPLMNPPSVPNDVDVLIMESTYGNRIHEDREVGVNKLVDVCNRILPGGRLLIPVFAVGRAQEVLFELKRLIKSNKIPKVPVYLDTPLGWKATELYRLYSYCLRKDLKDLFLKGKNPFEFDQLEYVKGAGRSQEIAESDENCIILSASGMLEGGRVLNHLPRILTDENSAILFVGYQAEGTLGRKILDGSKLVDLNGHEINVNCQVYSVNCFSAHADANGLVNFVESMNVYPSRIYLVHGEKSAIEGLFQRLPKVRRFIPKSGEVHEVKGIIKLAPSTPKSESNIEIEGDINFVNAFGLEFSNDIYIAVKEGKKIRFVRKRDFVEMLKSRIEDEFKEVRALVTTAYPTHPATTADEGSDVISKLEYFKERGILSKSLARNTCELLLKGNRDEVISDLNLRLEKKRFNVQDEKLMSEFVDYMVRLINSCEEEFVVNCLCTVYPDLRRLLS